MAYAGAVTLPTSEVVAAADSSSAMYNVLQAAPTGDTNHVLCRGQDEPLGDFIRRVEWRLRSLRRKSSIRRVSYLLGPHSPQDWLCCRQAFVTLIELLGSGAEFELVTAPTLSIDVVQTLDELVQSANVGVRVSIRRERAIAPVSAVVLSTSDNPSTSEKHSAGEETGQACTAEATRHAAAATHTDKPANSREVAGMALLLLDPGREHQTRLSHASLRRQPARTSDGLRAGFRQNQREPTARQE